MPKRTNETPSNNSQLKRQPTIKVRNQTKNDCLIYSIANVFMRKIVILLEWTTEDSSIEWDEVDPNTCDRYAPGRENVNEIKYKYCILYGYIQGILRKSFGSSGAFAEPTTKAFCEEFNRIMRTIITEESIPTHILRDNEIQDLKAQNRVYLNLFKKKSLTEELTEEEKEQFEDCKTVEKELDFGLNSNYKSTLVTTLQDIQRKLHGKEFDALTIILYDKKNSKIIENTDENFKSLIKELNDGFYGIMHIELSENLFNFFQRISINDNEESKRIINSIKEKSERKYQMIKVIERIKGEEVNSLIKADEKIPNDELEGLEGLKQDFFELEDELTELLSDYLELSTGISGRDPKTGERYELPLIDAFKYMEDTIKTHSHSMDFENKVFDSASNDVAADGHAVVVKKLFQIDSNNEFLVKNHWGEEWASKGEILFDPKERVYYANTTIIKIRDQASHSSNSESLGGKQSRKIRRKTRHKKTYRKLQRKLKITKKPKITKRTKRYKRK
jgi:hypothetical protein